MGGQITKASVRSKGGNGCSRFSGAPHPSSLRVDMAMQDPAQTFTEMADATAQLHFGIFDKRVLLPLSQLPECVLGETNEVLPSERLERLVEEGWVPRLQLEDGHEPGFPLYVASRVGLFLQLERQGYSPSELRAIASHEEEYIDNILVAEDSPYLDDDRSGLVYSPHSTLLMQICQSS